MGDGGGSVGQDGRVGAQHLLPAVGLVAVAAVAACVFSTSGLLEAGKGGAGSTSTPTTGGGVAAATGGGGAGAVTSSSSSGGDACTNGVKDPGEIAVDCGGPCPGCDDGTPCGADADCASGTCVEGVCCDDACASGCMTCRGDMNGGRPGACANVVVNEDPKAACSPGKCDGDGVCRCENGKKDGGETGVDCGGGCAGCGLTQACKADGDCAGGHCVTEWDGSKICCGTPCSGTCSSCNIGPPWAGVCLPRAAGDPTPCGAGKACNLSGSCTGGGSNGASCNGGGNCVSGLCHQNVCRAYSDHGGPCTSDWGCPGNPGACVTSTHTCQ